MGWLNTLSLTFDVVQVEVPASAATVVANPGTTVLLLNQASLLAALTVTFPANPNDGQRFAMSSATAVTALTLTGGTVKGALAAFTINGFARYVYNASSAAWWRVG